MDLTEKVETLAKQVNELLAVLDVISKSLAGGKHGKQRRSVRTKAPSGRPDWVEDMFKCVSAIWAQLESVKKILGTRGLIDSGHSQSNPDHEAQHRPEAQVSQAESGTDVPGELSATAPPDHDTIAPELPSKPGQGTTHGDCVLTNTTSIESPNLPTRLGKARLHPQSDDGTTPTFHCKYEDISQTLSEEKLEKFSSDPNVKEKGYFKLIVEDLPPLTVQEASINRPGKDHFTNFSCHRDSQGFVVVTKGQQREVLLPRLPFPRSQKSWSQSELREFWESTLKDPPLNMPYIIGDPLFPDIELSPGQRLEGIGGLDIRGVGTTYGYLSPGVSFSILHAEDADLASMNLLRAGAIKPWLFIKPAHNEKLERHMREAFPEMGHCSQSIRHLSRLIPPGKLDEWGVGYSLSYCAPGEVMVTLRGTLHEVGNTGPNCALSVNILFGPSPDIPLDYRFCETSCGPHALTKAHFRLPEERPLVEVQENRRGLVQPEKLAVGPSKIAGMKRKPLPTESRSRTPKLTPQIGSFLEILSGRQAFDQLCSLIYSWRDPLKPVFKKNDGRAPAVQLVQAIGALEKRSLLTEFLGRLLKVKLVEIIDKGKEGRTRADPEAITNLIMGLGWQNSKTNRAKLHHHLDEGRQWKRICDNFDGLLCLIPPNRGDGESLQISGRMCQELSNKDIELLHSSLESNEFVQSMCRMGETFQASIWSDVEVPEFKWESEDPQMITHLPVKDLATFMERKT